MLRFEGSAAERSGGRHLGHHAVLLQLTVVALGSVVTDEVDNNAGGKGNDSRDDAHGTPRLFGVAVEKHA